MIKIKFGEHTLYLAEDVCSFHLDSIEKKRAIVYRYSKPKQLKEILQEIPIQRIKSHIIYHADEQELFREISSNFVFIQAAGGLVTNEYNQILFIFRNNKWDLPKGKMELGETCELTAVREVEEECGLKVSLLKQHLITTYHTYIQGEKKILKANHWYLMDADANQQLRPQIEEDIQKVEWKSITEIESLFENSYDSIQDVVRSYLEIKSIDK